jgi:hypothetical protein
MRRATAITICIIFLAFGLIRVGVGSALIGQELGALNIEALSAPIEEVEDFIEKRQDQQIIKLNVLSYLGVIVFMGVSLALGAVGALRRKGWGLALIGVYLLTHAGLFVNFQTVNPKIAYFGIGVLLYAVLILVNRRTDQ